MDAFFPSSCPSPPLGWVTYIFVIDTFHEHQFPVCPLGMGLVLEGSAQLLDGHISVQDSIVAGTAEEEKTKKRRGRFLVFRAGWITLCVIAWHCDNPPWKSSVTKTKGLFFTSPSKQSLTEIDDGWLCVSTYNLVWEAIFSRGIVSRRKTLQSYSDIWGIHLFPFYCGDSDQIQY